MSPKRREERKSGSREVTIVAIYQEDIFKDF
jgi:hypothetical protein